MEDLQIDNDVAYALTTGDVSVAIAPKLGEGGKLNLKETGNRVESVGRPVTRLGKDDGDDGSWKRRYNI
jgi:hypothetical protein